MSDIEETIQYRISRGRNWSHKETQFFVTVLENNYSRLVQKKRKAPIFDSMSRQLKNNYGIERTGKEVQNKYKSLIAEYRSELASSSKQQGPSNGGKFKWFHRLDALIKSQLFDDKDFESPQTELQNSECTPEQITLESDESITFLSCADQSPTFETHSMEATIEDFVPQPLFTDKSIKKLHKSHHRKRKRDHFAETSSQLKFLREELKQETSNSNDRLSKMHSSLDELRHFLQRVDGNLSNISSLLYQLVHNKPPVQTPVLPQSYKKFSSVMVMSPPQVVHRQYHQQHQRCYSQYLTRHELESQLDGSTEENGERSFLNL